MDRLEAACRLASESASGQGGPMTVGLRRFVSGLLAGWRLLLEAAALRLSAKYPAAESEVSGTAEKARYLPTSPELSPRKRKIR